MHASEIPNPDTERLYWAPDRIDTYRLERLRESISRARNSAFYGPRLADVRLESIDDVARLPKTTKDDVRKASPLGLLAIPPDELVQYHESFGTTGTPAASWLSAADLDNYASQINQAAVDFRPGDRVLVRFPYAISVPAHIVTHAARGRGACVIPASSRTAITPYPRVIDLLTKLEATVIGCLPMEAVWLALAARAMGREPARDFPQLRAICTAGEMLSDARRRRIAELWNVEVYNMYGCTEGGNIAAACSAGRLHLAWDHFLLEVLDEQSGEPVEADELGTAALTTLSRQAMPLVRYLLGDYLRLLPGFHCTCGRTAPVVEHFGRDLNRFQFAGRHFFVRDLEERLLAAPVEAIGNLWLVDVRPEAVHFRFESDRPDASLFNSLQQQLGDELGLPLRLDPVATGNLLDRSRLMRVEPVRKPRVVSYSDSGESAPKTLDELMSAPAGVER